MFSTVRSNRLAGAGLHGSGEPAPAPATPERRADPHGPHRDGPGRRVDGRLGSDGGGVCGRRVVAADGDDALAGGTSPGGVRRR